VRMEYTALGHRSSLDRRAVGSSFRRKISTSVQSQLKNKRFSLTRSEKRWIMSTPPPNSPKKLAGNLYISLPFIHCFFYYYDHGETFVF
jgi:hypothetical protein